MRDARYGVGLAYVDYVCMRFMRGGLGYTLADSVSSSGSGATNTARFEREGLGCAAADLREVRGGIGCASLVSEAAADTFVGSYDGDLACAFGTGNVGMNGLLMGDPARCAGAFSECS